jgi:hypothetical protein
MMQRRRKVEHVTSQGVEDTSQVWRLPILEHEETVGDTQEDAAAERREAQAAKAPREGVDEEAEVVIMIQCGGRKRGR